MTDRVTKVLDEVQDTVVQGIEDLRAYLASPEGERLRRRLAQAMIVAAPLVFRSRAVRATWLGRALALAGGAAVVVKLAEALRDWQPAGSVEPVVSAD